MTVIDRQHAHTVRLEAQALERRTDHALGLADATHDAVPSALLAIAKRLELLEAAITGYDLPQMEQAS